MASAHSVRTVLASLPSGGLKIVTALALSLGLLVASCGGKTPTGAASSVFPDEAGSPVVIEIENNLAIMVGTLDASTPALVAGVIAANPLVDTFVLKAIPGTLNTAVSLNAGRAIRAAGLNTIVPSGGAVASGGTDLFLAGVVRIVEAGGRVGVHEWVSVDGNGDRVLGSDIPRADPRHLVFRNYYAEMSIPEDFYWFSINAAGPEDIHWMTDKELVEFDVVTSTP